MLAIFPWSELLETGIASIDQQHRRLVDLLNELARQYVNAEGPAATRRIVAELSDYAAYHFESEEAIWRSELPAGAAAEHEAAHRAFSAKIQGLQAQPLDGAEVQQELLAYLLEWLAFHILDTDRVMAWVVQGMRQGLSHNQAVAAAEARKQGDEGRIARIIMDLYQRMAMHALSLMREREAQLRGLDQQHQQAQTWLREDLLRAQAVGRIGSWKQDLASETLEWSPETYRILGIPADQPVCPADFFQTIHPEDRQRVQAAWEAALAGATYEVEHRICRHDEVVWVRSRADFHVAADGGKRLAIGTIQDISEDILREQRESFEQNFRNLVAEVSARFLPAISDDSFDLAMNQTLAELGDLFQVDRAFLFIIDEGGLTWSNTHEWCADGIQPQKQNLQAAPLAQTPWWVEHLRHNQPVRIDRVADLPEAAAAERALLQAQDIQSLICLPTRDQSEQLSGFIGFDSVRSERRWNGDQIKVLQVIADIIATAHARREAARVLAQSREDLLRAQAVARIGSWKYDFARDHLEWSPETYRLFGIRPDTPIDMNRFLSHVYPADREPLIAAWKAARCGGPYEFEHRTTSSHGQTWLRGLAEFRPGPDGKPAVAIGTVQDITNEKDHEQQLKTLAFIDSLTGLPNQHGFEQELELRMEQSALRGLETCLFQIDIDSLGQINAAMGMQSGDRILRVIGQRLSESAGTMGHVGRLGGDQFAVAIHDGCHDDNMETHIRAMQDLINQPIRVDGDVIRVTACIGSVHNHANIVTQAGVLLRMADQAIYQAKLGGRNQHVAFNLTQYLSDRSRHDRLIEIREALHQGQLRLYYQPKVNLLNGELMGVEGLLRWQHPQRGLLSPGELIPHIEDHPLMIEVGNWVIDTAIQQLEDWQQAGFNTRISVNVASSQLDNPDLVEQLAECFRNRTNIQPGQLELEVVETGPMLNLPAAVQTFRQLKDLGVLISLDDFGTGHASLQTLSMLAPNIVKIDQSFVRDMLDDRASRSIVQAILDLSGAFRLRVVAEGIETPEHGRELQRLGCRFGQGHAIAHAMPAAEIIDWAEQWRRQPPAWIGDNPVRRAVQTPGD